MPTVSARIDVAMEGGDLLARVAEQTAHLASAGTLLSDLVAAPPSSLDDFVAALASVELPELDLAAELSSALEGLSAALPGDFASVIEGAVTVSGSLKVIVDGELVPQIEKLVSGVMAIADVIERLGSLAPEAGAEAGAAPGAATPAAEGGAPPGEGSGESSSPAEERRAARAAAIAEISQRLDELPDPLDAPAIVAFFRQQLSLVRRELLVAPYVPVFDDLAFLFDTVMDLQEADSAALEAHVRTSAESLAAFLAGARAPVDGLVAALEAAAATAGLGTLEAATRGLIDGLGRIAAAVRTGDVGSVDGDVVAVNAALDTLLPQLSALDGDAFAAQVDAATDRFERLTSDMDAALRRVAHATVPPGYLSLLGGVGAALEEALAAAGTDELGEDMRAVLDAVADTLDRVDAGALVDPVQEVVAELEAACGVIDGVLATTAAEAAALFDELDRVLDEIDLSAITDAVRDALAEFVGGLERQVDALFAPVREALAEAIGTIADTVGEFDPEDVVGALTAAIGSLRDALTHPEVTAAIEAIRSTVEGVARDVQTISFSPITDAVVATIEEITAALRAIDPAALSPPVTIALNAAVALLPPDLTPVTDPLEAEFGVLVETGPMPLLESVRGQPALLLERINALAPSRLIGGQLSEPFDALIASLEAVVPTRDLLAPVQAALEEFTDGLREAADPSALVAPLQAGYDELLERLDAADPSTLVAPVRTAIEDAVSAVTEAIPLDDVFGVFEEMAIRIQGAIDVVTGVRTIVEKTAAAAQAMTGAEEQLRDWVEQVVQKVDGIADLAGIQAAFDDVATALDGLASNDVEEALDVPLVPLRDALVALAPGPSLTALSTAHRAVGRPAVEALPASPQRTALLALLDRFDPLDVAFAAPYRRLQAWLDAVTRDEARWRAFLPGWSRRTGEVQGPVAGLRHAGVTKAQLKDVLRAGFEDELVKPIAATLDAISTAAEAVAVPIEQLVHFGDELESKLQTLLGGPVAIGSVREGLESLVSRIADVDVDFLVDELQGVLDAVKAKFEAVSPQRVGELLKGAFDDAVAILDVTALLPTDALAELDETYRGIVDGLKQLDPTALVVDAVQPVFDEQILPIVAAFDITIVIEALIEALNALRLDLGLELDRVNEAYKEMLAAVPAMSLLDISLDVDVEIDVGF
jgi:hypothetical protein